MMTIEEQFVGLHVLVAEDNNVNAFVITQFFTRWGITTDIAENGSIAVDMVSQKKYDLVFMDLNMPVMDGCEAAKIILANHTGTKIIALTAMTEEETVDAIAGTGILAYVTKPFNPESLSQAIKNALNN